jgi:hypothetical protein
VLQHLLFLREHLATHECAPIQDGIRKKPPRFEATAAKGTQRDR